MKQMRGIFTRLAAVSLAHIRLIQPSNRGMGFLGLPDGVEGWQTCCFGMLSISGVKKAFGGRTLFADASVQVNRQDRIGLVGPNGAGKSTLLNLILGTESPDEGQIILERNVSIGFL